MDILKRAISHFLPQCNTIESWSHRLLEYLETNKEYPVSERASRYANLYLLAMLDLCRYRNEINILRYCIHVFVEKEEFIDETDDSSDWNTNKKRKLDESNSLSVALNNSLYESIIVKTFNYISKLDENINVLLGKKVKRRDNVEISKVVRDFTAEERVLINKICNINLNESE